MSTTPPDRALRILSAASELFVRYGAAKTSMQDIASHAGISKGALYLEFPGREALLHALVRHEFRAYLAAASARVAADPEGGRLSRIYYHCLGELAARPMVRALYTGDAAVLGAMVRRDGAARHAPRLLLGREFVEAMQAAGLIRAELDPAALSHAMGVMSVGFLMAQPVLHQDGGVPMEETASMLAAMLTGFAEPEEGEPDLAAGAAAFTALCRKLDEAIATPPPSAFPRPRPLGVDPESF